jgi:major membrane immunogen (membrane-anchored lipoprotein)
MKPVWDTQAKNVSKYVVDNQGTAGLLNDKGYTDVVSGVSINVAGFAALADQAIAQANGADGVYEVKAEADDKGNYAFVSVTIEGGKITAVTWDEVYNGSLKSELSLTGKYVMKPVWDTQAKNMCQYVVDNQTTAGLNLTEAGKTDVVSGVSISVNGFTGLVEEALKQASVTGVIPAPAPATKVDATVVDVVSGATVSSKAVIRAINEGFVYLRDFVFNK